MGEERFNRLLLQRTPEKLQHAKHMLYEHALRCYCKLCGSLLNWDCPRDISYTEAECCGLSDRLQPWTVKVHVEDVSARPVLPRMEGSSYADPNLDLRGSVIGELAVETKQASPLTAAQRSLRPPQEKPTRRCGVCRTPGHTRRTCPNA